MAEKDDDDLAPIEWEDCEEDDVLFIVDGDGVTLIVRGKLSDEGVRWLRYMVAHYGREAVLAMARSGGLAYHIELGRSF